ncbi:MAG: ferredoxin--NADP reductase [Saprospiraceae bacterium]|nr:ferredoxin--NADP reductase [Saprospiraceae bacterium]
MSGDFISIKIKEVRKETEDAVSILFEQPEEYKERLQYRPGQYITIKWMDGDKELRRSYSISSVPDDPYLAITVKEVEGGKISPLLCRQLKPGDYLEMMPPEGRFTAEFGQDQKRNIYLIGAGSGITPLMSIARFVLEKEPKSSVILLYGSRTEAQIIFKEEFERMTQRYQNQFFVYHTLSKPDGGGLGIVKSLFGRKKSDWQGLIGRISPSHLKDLLKHHPLTKNKDKFFLCGPGDFILMADKALLSAGISEDGIKKEFFTAASTDPSHEGKPHLTRTKGIPAQVKVHLRGQEIDVEVSDKTILDTMLDGGYDAPYSCHSGACATCMAKIITGKVEMDACFALSDKEIANGYILACQSRPLTDSVEITFDE